MFNNTNDFAEELVTIETGEAADVTVSKRLLAKNIKRLRKARELSQGALAQKVGVSPGYISHLENGESTVFIGAEKLDKFAAALGVSVAELFMDSDRGPSLPKAGLSVKEALSILNSQPGPFVIKLRSKSPKQAKESN